MDIMDIMNFILSSFPHINPNGLPGYGLDLRYLLPLGLTLSNILAVFCYYLPCWPSFITKHFFPSLADALSAEDRFYLRCRSSLSSQQFLPHRLTRHFYFPGWSSLSSGQILPHWMNLSQQPAVFTFLYDPLSAYYSIYLPDWSCLICRHIFYLTGWSSLIWRQFYFAVWNSVWSWAPPCLILFHL